MENGVKEDLYKYLRSVGELDERIPECPDVADAWRKIAEAYLPDGIWLSDGLVRMDDVSGNGDGTVLG